MSKDHVQVLTTRDRDDNRIDPTCVGCGQHWTLCKGEPENKADRYPGFPLKLKDIKFGVLFRMLNYSGHLFMRVRSTDGGICLTHPNGECEAVLDLEDGFVFWMAKGKPCALRD